MNEATWSMMSLTGISYDSAKHLVPARSDSEVPLPLAPNESNVVIAPWLAPEDQDEPPTPPPKYSQRPFPHKPSLASFGISSATNLLAPRSGRPSKTHSIAESGHSTLSESLNSQAAPGLRKSKSSMFSHLLKKSRSKPLLRADSEQSQDLYLSNANVPAYASGSVPFLRGPRPPSPTFLSRKEIGRTKKKSTNGRPPPLPPKDPPIILIEPMFSLDTDLTRMDGIVDSTVLKSIHQEAGSPGSGFESFQSSGLSQSDSGQAGLSSSPTTSIFSNPYPFFSSTSPSKRKPHSNHEHRKIDPKTILDLSTTNVSLESHPDAPSWEPPESWSVEKEGVALGEPDSSSSECSIVGRPTSMVLNAQRKKVRRKTAVKPLKTPSGYSSYKIRIYRTNNTFHVASIGLTVTVSELTPVLNQKLLTDGERETHRLYLKERGRERLLAQTERPADIVRRRLEQCGYDPADGLELLGADDLSFLLKFVYKSQLLGPAEEELTIKNFEYIDLKGRSLRTVPVVLYANADSIIMLNLSRNPILEIPLDFIQSCTTLRELRLSQMAMKKVPQSVRHSATLRHLDLSSNRIVDLNDAGLDRLTELTSLSLQNNRMEKLPWYFPRLRTLKTLNISNNKFLKFPDEVNKLGNLLDLDISFNMIAELPEQIGQLVSLEMLTIVGNEVMRFPDECSELGSLRVLDCRRNHITDLSVMCMLPKLGKIFADYNDVHSLDLSLGPSLNALHVSHNDITQLTLIPGPVGRSPYALTTLDISHAKLSSLDGLALAQLTSLRILKADHNSFRFMPDSLGELTYLVDLSCSDNQLDTLPASIGRLQNLQTLDVHNNNLTELPASLWSCSALVKINVTSNLLNTWHDPPLAAMPTQLPNSAEIILSERTLKVVPDRKTSLPGPDRKPSEAGTIGIGRALPPLAHSLQWLYLGENRIPNDALHPLMIFKELRILNLSFNDIQVMPPSFFKNLTNLEEMYLSGNQLSSIPTEDLHRLKKLSVLFLNGNHLQSLPHELGKVKSLNALDVGSNMLKYNINNWEFDWNWNFNPNLKYLNLSGNKRLEIKPDVVSHRTQVGHEDKREVLADFSGLTQLRILGLMDVTTTFVPNIPDENEDRRVRTSSSMVNKMAYGIADTLGKNEHLYMFDLVQPEFRDRPDEAIFAMFGRTRPAASNSQLSKYLHDHFVSVFIAHLNALDSSKGEGVTDALRRSFLKLNKLLHDKLYLISSSSRKMSQASTSTSTNGLLGQDMFSLRSGASGIVLYLVDKTLYVANAGDALAIVSKQGAAEPASKKHDPSDRNETARIRSAEGWVSPKGLVNDELDVSRSFGFYHLLPVVNARPYIHTYQLTELDEFVIVGNRGLWDFVSFQTAVDIARSESDPMIAAQKLRDFAISYGVEGSTMIMVIRVADLFNTRTRQPTVDSIVDYETSYPSVIVRKRRDDTGDRDLTRLNKEVPAPVGHLALVFTDIRNSTHLWEANAGMNTAMRLHNKLLRRQLRFCGGYEVKTEGDAFMCSFPTSLAALWWCLTVQVQLLRLPWPSEILECEDGKEIKDPEGRLIARGLSVRMGMHSGTPLCEPDPITHRMDYFGSMVNRSARICGSAAGGQIMISADVIREINARINQIEPWTEYSDRQPIQAVEAIRRIGITVFNMGELKLKGIEVPELLSLVYPADLAGRHKLLQTEPEPPTALGSRIQFSVEQIQALGHLCLRLEALSSSRIFRSRTERKRSVQKPPAENDQSYDAEADDNPMETIKYMSADPVMLLPALNDKVTDEEMMGMLDSLSVRIDNARSSLQQNILPEPGKMDNAISALERDGGFDELTLQRVLSILRSV